jgi:membrane protein YqaA with SNARE-associated domain
MKKRLENLIHRLKQDAEKTWYPVVLSVAAVVYHFLLVTPVDSLFVASSLIAPKRWFTFAVATTTGFTIGGTTFAYLVSRFGPSFVERFIPGITHHAIWTQSESWMHQYGAFAVGGISLIPFTLHPLVALAGLEHMSLFIIALSLFIGRLMKYSVMGWFCAYLPKKIPFHKHTK